MAGFPHLPLTAQRDFFPDWSFLRRFGRNGRPGRSDDHGNPLRRLMHTPDCKATYEELLAKGVVFKGPPKEQFYGTEAIITDRVGNWFSMTQPK